MSEQIKVGAEYYETLMRIAAMTAKIKDRVKQSGIFDPRLLTLTGEAESLLDDLREMEEKGDI